MTVLNKTCIRIFSIILAALFVALSICFLYFSFQSSDNNVLKLLGESPDESMNNHYERKV